MQNSFGKKIKLNLDGSSHDAKITVTLSGLPAKVFFDETFINNQLTARRPAYPFNSARIEKDTLKIISGIENQYTTGDPIVIVIPNTNHRSKDYHQTLIRPSHADYSSYVKYGVILPGGGIFSGRMSVALVVMGALCQSILVTKNIIIGSHIHRCAGYQDSYQNEELPTLISNNRHQSFVVYNPLVKTNILQKLNELNLSQDSLGAIIETNILNLPAGLGEPFFNSLESIISHGIFSIGGVKGLEFGLGFSFVDQYGSQVNDPFYYDEESLVKTTTNNNGGINGGISNGMPINFKTVFKPPSSIAITQNTIDLNTKTNTKINITGRHDHFYANRAMVAIDNLVAFILLDFALQQFGDVWLD